MAAQKSAKKASDKKTSVKKAAPAKASKAKKATPAAAKKEASAKNGPSGKGPSKSASATSKASAPKKSATQQAPAKKASAKKASAKKPPGAKAVDAAPPKAAPKSGKKVAPVAPSARAAGVEVGSPAPAFELADQTGVRVSSKSLAGKPYVLYFYPKDNTPGCTQEACDFRDRHPSFERAKVRVFGVSGDSEKSHRGFAEKYSLPFSLLVDEGNVLATAYGAYGPKKLYGREFLGILRSTFVIGADGRVKKIYRGVKVSGHADAVLAEVSGL